MFKLSKFPFLKNNFVSISSLIKSLQHFLKFFTHGNVCMSFYKVLCLLFYRFLHVVTLLHSRSYITSSSASLENITWGFPAWICGKNLPWEFATTVCCGNLPQLFAVGICCSYLMWEFVNLNGVFCIGQGKFNLPNI